MNRKRPRAGFTLIEMMVVVGILMVLAAIAIPNMITVISSARQRNIMSMVSGILQQGRSQAVVQNRVMSVQHTLQGSQFIYFVKDAAISTPTLSVNDPQMPLGENVTYINVPSGSGSQPTPLTSTQMWGASGIPFDTNGVVSFNSRGLPCLKPTTSPNCSTGSGYVLYYNYLPPFGADRWAAISISPAGRVKAWYWNGSAWGN